MTRFDDVEDELARELDDEVRELTDPLTRRLEGVRHLVDGGLPFLAFFAGYRWHGVEAGAVAAFAIAVVIAVVRLWRGERLVAVGLGAFAVALSSAIALASGEGRSFFVTGLLFNGAALLVTLGSLAARRPASGELSRRVHREEPQWRSDPARYRVHVRITWFWSFLWAWHLAVLVPLYAASAVGALSFVSTFVLKPSILLWLVVAVAWAERSKTHNI